MGTMRRQMSIAIDFFNDFHSSDNFQKLFSDLIGFLMHNVLNFDLQNHIKGIPDFF